MQAAASGVDAIVYLVGVNYWEFELHPRLMQQTLDGPIEAGVKLHLFRSAPTIHMEGREPGRFVRTIPANRIPSKAACARLRRTCPSSRRLTGNIEATVLRLPDFYGPGVDKSFLHAAFTAAVNGGVANMIGLLDEPHESVFVPDVGPVVACM